MNKYNLLLIFTLLATSCLAQGKASKGRAAEAFHDPFEHFSFVSFRFDRLTNKNNTFVNHYTVRAVTTRWAKLHLRMNAPLVNTNVSGINEFGLGDIDIRALYSTPVNLLHKRLYFATSCQLYLPTATSDNTGAHKWQVRPGIGLVFFRGSEEAVTGTYSLGVEYWASFAESSGHARTNTLAIMPNFDWWFHKWYIGYYATWTYNFETHMWDIPFDVEAGYTIFPHITLGAEIVLPLTNTVDYRNDWLVKLRYTF